MGLHLYRGNSLKAKTLSLTLGLLAISQILPAAPVVRTKSLCGTFDLRERTYDPKIARARLAAEKAGCTITMIGKACAVSAGHCVETFELAEFNLPDPKEGEDATVSSAEETYKIDVDSVVSKNHGPGADWAVLKLQKNEVTQKYAGEVQGHYQVSFEKLEVGEMVTIKGHGYADDPLLSFSQLGHTGAVVTADAGMIEHRVDTTGGSSGSSIIRTSDQKIVGIHTHGGCYPAMDPMMAAGGSTGLENYYGFFDFFNMPNANGGTEIHGSPDLQAAIQDCLAWEEQEFSEQVN